jgi:hypothetical protein
MSSYLGLKPESSSVGFTTDSICSFLQPTNMAAATDRVTKVRLIFIRFGLKARSKKKRLCKRLRHIYEKMSENT